MPLLTIRTSIALKNKQQLAKTASHTIASILGKPESYVMVHIQDEQCLIFAGDNSPCALLELKSLGLPENMTADLSSRLCDFITTETGIVASRTYIEFSNPERHLWGWNQRTFRLSNAVYCVYRY